MFLDRVVDRLGGLSGRPSGRPVSDLPKTPRMGPGPAGTQNRHFLNKTSIEKCHDSDGRRIRGFWSSRPRPDSPSFGPLVGPIFGYDLLESRVPDLFESHVPDLLESHVPDLPEYHGPDLPLACDSR